MDIEEIIHPEDAKALNTLKSIPALPQLMKKLFEYGYDDILWSDNITMNLRLSEKQMPDLYNRLPPICKRLGIPVPELYLQMSPIANAWTSGYKKVHIVITLGLIRRLKDEELDAVLAHECGHIVCQHVLYTTLANAIFSLGDSVLNSMWGFLGSTALEPIRQALITWCRASELSADRIACVVSSAEVLTRALARLSLIPNYIVDSMDLKAWAEQGKDFENLREGSTWNKIVRWMSDSDNDHPYNPVRAYQAMVWEKTTLCRKLRSDTRCLYLSSSVPEIPTVSESVKSAVSSVEDVLKDKVGSLTKDAKVNSFLSKFNIKMKS